MPVADPAWHAAKGENNRKQLNGYADGLDGDAGVKVYIRVELALNEVLVFTGNFFQLVSDFQQWFVAGAQLGKYRFAGLFHDLGAGIKVLIDPMTKTHQFEGVVLVFGPGNILGHT